MTTQGDAARDLARMATEADDEATRTLARLLFYQDEASAERDPQLAQLAATGDTIWLDELLARIGA